MALWTFICNMLVYVIYAKIKADISGNTANADGIRPGHSLIRYDVPAFLQVLGKSFPIKDHQTV